MSCVSVPDLEARVGSLTDEQKSRAPQLITDALALARTVHRRSFGVVENDIKILRVNAGRLVLPDAPVASVSEVVSLGPTAGDHRTLTLGTDWEWDWIDTITFRSCVPGSVRVTYTHGRPAPEELVAQVATMVNRVLLSPSKIDGITQESTGQVSVQFQQGMGSNGTGVRMFPSDRQVFEGLSRSRSGSTRVIRG